MYFNFQCPLCHQGLKVREEHAGRSVRCPFCKGGIQIPEAPEAPAAAPLAEAPQRDAPGGESQSPAGAPPREAAAPRVASGGGASPPKLQLGASPRVGKAAAPGKRGKAASQAGQGDGASVNLLVTAIVGLAATVVFYALLFPLPKANYLSQLFYNRGWVTYAEAFLFFWSLAILTFKYFKLRRQQSSMLFDLLPDSLGADITHDNVDQFARHVRELPVNPGQNFLVRRVLRGLEHYRVRGSASEAADMLSSQADIDAATVSGSYTLLTVFIWAIPILGFIGTVQGLGDAVAQLSQSLQGASGVDEIKNSLSGITSGLGVAFDTTLVALLMSLLLKFPASSLQNAEEDQLTWVDEYCNENLLRRLRDRDGAPGDDALDQRLRRLMETAFASQQAELRAWTARLREIGAVLTDEVTRGLRAAAVEWRQQQEAETAKLENLRESSQRQVEAACAALASVTAASAQTEQARLSQAQAATTSLANSARQLEASLLALGQVLGELNGKQIVIEHAAPRADEVDSERPAGKRGGWGWFGRR